MPPDLTQGDRTMRKPFVPTLALTLLILGIAGIAWAGQTAVQAPQNPTPEATVQDQAPEATLPAEGDELGEITLEGLFQDPVKVDACCFADCLSQRDACLTACGGDQACRDECQAEYQACKSHC
jgi:hypothetical protein